MPKNTDQNQKKKPVDADYEKHLAEIQNYEQRSTLNFLLKKLGLLKSNESDNSSLNDRET